MACDPASPTPPPAPGNWQNQPLVDHLRLLILRRVSLALLIGFFALANLLVPGLFWDTGGSDFWEYLAIFLAGGAVAQVCLLAIWGALAAKKLKYRIPISAGLVLVAACSYILGLQLPDLPDSTMPLILALLMIGLGIAMYAVLFVPLAIVRRLTQKRIVVPAEAPRNEPPSAQFGLRYLLMCPLVVAGIIILLQYSLPRGQNQFGPGLRDIIEVLFGAAVFIGFSMLICIPCIWLTLAESRRRIWAICVGVVWLAGPCCVFALIRMRYGIPGNSSEALFSMAAFGTGLLATTLLVLYILRLLGYRLLGRSGVSPFATEPAGTCPFATDPLQRGDSPADSSDTS